MIQSYVQWDNSKSILNPDSFCPSLSYGFAGLVDSQPKYGVTLIMQKRKTLGICMNKILFIITLIVSLVIYRTYTYRCNTCNLIFEYGEQGTKICPRDGSFMVPDYDY